MNTFGRIFRVSVFGESHGEGVGVVLDGVPAGLSITEGDFQEALHRRKGLGQKGTTPRKEEDLPQFLSGVFQNYSTGSPICIFFPNRNTRSEDYARQRAIPRPGHADFVARKKYKGFEDFRGGGHFSARLTVGIVAAGCIARKMMVEQFALADLAIRAWVAEVGGDAEIERGLQRAVDQKDSVGGIVRGEVLGLPLGLGEPFWGGLDSLLAQAFFAIPAVKGVSFGAGFEAANMFGSVHNDPIEDETGRTRTNHAGGLVGGLSNGNPLCFQIAFKPTSSTPKPQTSLNWETGEMETFSIKGRHDLCVALRAPVIVEAMAAIVLADACLVDGHF